MSEPPLQDAQAAAGLTLTEALRTVGLGLEVHQVPRAEIAVAADGISVTSDTAYGRHQYPWAVLAIHSSAHRESRGDAAAAQADDLARWSILLRIVGQMLEADGVRDCEITATVAEQGAPPPWRVAVTTNGRVRLRTEDVQVHVLRTEQQAAAERPEPPDASGSARGEPR